MGYGKCPKWTGMRTMPQGVRVVFMWQNVWAHGMRGEAHLGVRGGGERFLGLQRLGNRQRGVAADDEEERA